MMDRVVYVLFLCAGFAMVYFGWRFRAKAGAAASWPRAEGSIVSLEFDDQPDATGPTSYQTNVTYVYSVRGVRYQSSRIAFGYSATRDRQFELEFFTRLKESPSVQVRYNPDQPDEATLDCWKGKPRGSALVVCGLLWLGGTSIIILLSALSS